jgi:bifunctional UDP-N-acetylglucosamine pyrophosphorylase/glucosamine-1-phosphate N-acetyltransferase
MYAVVLAAGRGTRMRSLTDRRPKPLLSVGRHTLLEHVFDAAIGVGDNSLVTTRLLSVEQTTRLVAHRILLEK